MKKFSVPSRLAALFVTIFAVGAASAQEIPEAERKANMEKVCRFIKACPCYFIATVDGDQPRVRPFGTVNIFDGKLYVQTGRTKNVAKQLLKNGKTELCAYNGKQWIRLSGTLVPDDRREAKAAMLDAYPSLKKMYSADDGKTLVLYFTDAQAVIDGFGSKKEVLKF